MAAITDQALKVQRLIRYLSTKYVNFVMTFYHGTLYALQFFSACSIVFRSVTKFSVTLQFEGSSCFSLTSE